jgi:hypothetical protein
MHAAAGLRGLNRIESRDRCARENKTVNPRRSPKGQASPSVIPSARELYRQGGQVPLSLRSRGSRRVFVLLPDRLNPLSSYCKGSATPKFMKSFASADGGIAMASRIRELREMSPGIINVIR